MRRGGCFLIRRGKGRKDHTVLSGTQNSSASWKTAGWHGRANDKGFLFRVVILKIMPGDFNRKAFVHIPEVLSGQGFPVVFRMSGDKNWRPIRWRSNRHRLPPTLPAASAAGGENVLVTDGCMAGMRREEKPVKASNQRMRWLQDLVFKHAEHLLRQRVFGNPIMMIERCLSAPTDMKGRINMGFRPIHESAQFRPVIHFLKGHLLHRCAGNNETVKTFLLNISKGFVKFQQMFSRRIFRSMGGSLQQLDIHL